MAAAFDFNLGESDGVASTSIALTTNHAASVGTRIVAIVSYFALASADHVTNITGGSLTFTKDLRIQHTNGSDTMEIWSVPAPSGLATSTAMTLSVSATFGGTLMGMLSVSGVDMTNGAGVAGTGSSNAQSGTAFTSGASSSSAGIAVGGAGLENLATQVGTTVTTGTKVHDNWNSGAQQGFVTGYNIGGTTIAATVLAGSSTSTATTGAVVTYATASASGLPDLIMGPPHR